MNTLRCILNIPWIATMVNHKAGGFAAQAVAFVISHLTVLFGAHGLQMTPATYLAVTSTLSWLLGTVFSGLIQVVQTGSTKELQGTLSQILLKAGLEPIKVDGWVGKETLAGGVKVLKAIAADT